MVNASVLTSYLVSSLLIVGGVCSSHLANEGEWKRSQLEPRQSSKYIRIVQGLLRSDKIVRLLSDIPCDIIQKLESEAEEAKNFIDEFEHGKVPTIIQNLPNEVIKAFSDVVGTFKTLPTQIVGAAEAAVTDAVNVFNDIESGAIVSDLQRVPGVIVSDITNAWGDLKNVATGALACLLGHCSITTTAVRICGSTHAITAESSFQSSLPSRSSAIHLTPSPLSNIPSPTQTGLKPSSSPVELSQLPSSTLSSSPSPTINAAGSFRIDKTILQLKFFHLYWVLGLGSLGVIFLL